MRRLAALIMLTLLGACSTADDLVAAVAILVQQPDNRGACTAFRGFQAA